jgi:hypothetical protein
VEARKALRLLLGEIMANQFIKVAPFLATDVVATPGFQMYRLSGSALVADGPRRTSPVRQVLSLNGYAVALDDTLITRQQDGSYRGIIVWDTGETPPVYVMDEVYWPPTKALVDMSQVVPTANTAGSVGDSLSAARAQGFGRWVKSGNVINLYGADDVTIVKSFTLDNADTPSVRS